MSRARKVCAEHGCANLTAGSDSRCAEHTPEPWAGSAHRTRNRRGDAKRNRRIMRAHAGICHVCGQPGADQVDHVIPLAEGGDDAEHNLRPIHGGPGSCHARKTSAEAAEGRRRATE